MAISYVGGVTAGAAGSTTNITISLSGTLTGGSDSSPSAGDLVIVTIAVGHTNDAISTVVVTADYTPLTILNADDSRDIQLGVEYKFMGETPDTSVVISGSDNASDAIAYTVQVFRGVDQTTPMDVTPVPATGTNFGRPDPGPITPATTGAWIVINTGASNFSATGFTYSEMTNVLTSAGSDTTDVIVGSGYYTAWSSGEFDPAADTTGSNSTNDSWAAYTLALRPIQGNTLDADATAAVTWGGRSTAASRISAAATASVTWRGASRVAAAASMSALTSAQWVGQGFILAAGAFDADATASLTWRGAIVSAAALSAIQTASLSWVGRSFASSSWVAASSAQLTWNGRSTAASAVDIDATTLLTWNGALVASSTLSAAAVASVTWNGEAIVSSEAEGVWSGVSTSDLTWDGAAVATADLSSTAVASITWNGTGIFPAAFDADAISSVTWTGVMLASASWNANTAATLNWYAESFASAGWQVSPAAALTWNGISTVESAWQADALGDLQWVGEGEGTPTTEDAAFSSSATAFVTFTAEIIAAASFSMEAESPNTWRIPVPPPRVIDGRRLSRIEDSDEEDIMLFMAAINTYLEQEDHDHY